MENNQIKGLKISESEYDLPLNKKGRLTILTYVGPSDPKKVLDFAVSEYVQYEGYHELIDANLDNPWMRVILSEINELKVENFDKAKHGLDKPISNGQR